MADVWLNHSVGRIADDVVDISGRFEESRDGPVSSIHDVGADAVETSSDQHLRNCATATAWVPRLSGHRLNVQERLDAPRRLYVVIVSVALITGSSHGPFSSKIGR